MREPFPSPHRRLERRDGVCDYQIAGWSAGTAVGKEGSRGKITAILSDFLYSLPVLRFFGMFFAFLSS